MTNAPTLTEKSKKQRDNIKNATKNFDYTMIADRLMTVSWNTAVTQLVWLNRFTSAQPSHLPQQSCYQNETHLKIRKQSSLKRPRTNNEPKRRKNMTRQEYSLQYNQTIVKIYTF